LNVSKRGWNGRRGSGTERTQVDAIAHKVLELLPIERERGDVAGVLALVHPDGDLGGPIDDTEPAAVRIFPLAFDFVEQRLETGAVLVLLLQGVPLAIQRLRVLLVRTQRLLQLLDFFKQPGSVAEPLRHSFLDLGDGEIETTLTTHEDVLRVGLIELVVGGGVEGGNMFVREGEDSVAGIAAARLHLLE